jgi:hypothetical protein
MSTLFKSSFGLSATGAGSHRKETIVSVVRPLPARPDVANLRKQAKALLTAWRGGDEQALARVRDFHPRGERLIAAGRYCLADAQLVVARGYGFASWARLVHHLRLPPRAQALHAMDQRFQTALAGSGETNTLGAVLGRRAALVWQAHRDGDPAAAELLRVALGARGYDEAVSRGLTLDDVRNAIAWEHGFADWPAVIARHDRAVDVHFEAAIDAMVAGDLLTLRTLLDDHPALVHARSPFGHHATLIHYIAANGVESSRQWQSPRNAAGVLRTLLKHGADPNAVCDTYDGGSAQTPLCLLVSSVHPAQAGVQASLVRELCHGGANPNGLDEDGLPLWTAITFGYPAAVDALARCGARVDNLVFAASVGDLPKVKHYLRDGRQLTGEQARSGQRIGVRGPLLDPDHLVEYALIYSAGLGRRAVVEFLLASRPDLSVTEPVFHSTAAGAARYHHRADIVALLSAT